MLKLNRAGIHIELFAKICADLAGHVVMRLVHDCFVGRAGALREGARCKNERQYEPEQSESPAVDFMVQVAPLS